MALLEILITAVGSGGDVERIRSGTWATVRYARKKGNRIFVMRRDGEIVVEDNASG